MRDKVIVAIVFIAIGFIINAILENDCEPGEKLVQTSPHGLRECR